MAKKEKTRTYYLHGLAHAYLRLALKTNNNLLTGALYQNDGYYFDDYYDYKYMVPVSRNNIYNVLAETLDEIEGYTRFQNKFSKSSEMSTLPGYNYRENTVRNYTMLDAFNLYGLITLYAFYKEILYNNKHDLEKAIDNACNSLKRMSILPFNPSKITTVDSMSANKATSIIKKSEKIDKALEKKKAELYLTLYFYNKTDNKGIFKNYNNIYEKFLDINELTPKQQDQLYELNPDLSNMTAAQLNFIITCNVDNMSRDEIKNTPSLFSFDDSIKVDKKGVDVKFDNSNLQDVGYKESLIKLHPTYNFSEINNGKHEPLFLNENGEHCFYNGKVYEGRMYQLKKDDLSYIPGEIAIKNKTNKGFSDQQEKYPLEEEDYEEPVILVDKNDFPVIAKGGKYYYQDGTLCAGEIFENRGGDLNSYDDQIEEETNNDNTADEDYYYFGREK